MKNWFIAALVTSVVVLPMIFRNKRNEKVVPVTTDENKRYNTDDFITDEEL